jgi:8-oxo-dGTP pyrophosphatase MutT (NUDIX family)
MRHTVRGIILKNKQILLVTGHGADFYWTPGGGVEAGETIVETLHREIKEELGVLVTNYKPYHSYEYADQKVDNFIIEIEGNIKVGEEITGFAWYDSHSDIIKPSNGFNDTLKPTLIKDGLIV